MHFTPYALPAILALLIKAGMFFYARYSRVHNLQTRLFLLFLFCLAIQNLAEIRFFLTHDNGLPNASDTGTWWYGAAILELAFLLHLAFVAATNWRATERNIPLAGMLMIYTPAFALEVMLWTTRLLIVGFEPMSYTVTQIPGPLYFLFQLYVVGYLMLTTGLLIYGSRALSSRYRRQQSFFLLLGITPFVGLAIAILILRHLGYRGFNATATLPFMVTFLLVVTAYATHQHRLFDIEFFFPWSKVRRRKTAFYRRIQELIAEIAEMKSVHKIVQSLSDTLRCPVALIGGPQPVVAVAGEALGVARFPIKTLRNIDQILIANEIAEAIPDIHRSMRQHQVAAIVPFHPHSQAASSWMLLGDAFSDQVYSPLDFKVVETLFSRLADHFLDNQLLLRSQLAEAEREMSALRQRLANAWEQLQASGKKLECMEQENRALLSRHATLLQDDIASIETDLLDASSSGNRTLDEHIFEFEARLIARALARCDDKPERAAELLGIPLVTLYYKIRQYHLRNRDQKH